MFPDFLPAAVHDLSEETSIQQAQAIQCLEVKLEKAEIPTTYVQLGEGQTPLMLLHGFDSSVLEFRRLQPLLAQSRETWAVDLLGFGFTVRSPQGGVFARCYQSSFIWVLATGDRPAGGVIGGVDGGGRRRLILLSPILRRWTD